MSWQRPKAQVSLDDEVLEQEGTARDPSRQNYTIAAAIVENRAKEIGIAFFNENDAALQLTQFAGVSLSTDLSSLFSGRPNGHNF